MTPARPASPVHSTRRSPRRDWSSTRRRFGSSRARGLANAASIVTQIGRETDVYVGCAMRVRRRGTREDLAPTALLWADCDTPRSLAVLNALEPRPTMIVASGSEQHAHAYWTLTRPMPVEQLQQANRRLAAVLGADQCCADAARILRPPDTLNFKHDPPRPVTLVEYTGARHRPETLLAALWCAGLVGGREGSRIAALNQRNVGLDLA